MDDITDNVIWHVVGLLACLDKYLLTIMLWELTLWIVNIYGLLENLSHKQYWCTQCESK